MAIAFRNAVALGQNFSSATVYMTANGLVGGTPVTTAQDDILLLWLTIGLNLPAPTLTLDGQFTLLNTWTGVGPNGQVTKLYWMRRGASNPGWQIAVASATAQWFEWSISSWSGCITSGAPWSATPVYNAITSRNPPNPNCPAITTASTNAVVVALGMGWNGWLAGGPALPSGYTVAGVYPAGASMAVSYRLLPLPAGEDPASYANQITGANEIAEATLALAVVRPTPSSPVSIFMYQGAS